MIEVRNLTKSYRTVSGRDFVFRNLSFTIPDNKNVALIGRNGVGKSTIIRLLAGLDSADSGEIISKKRISWPVGLSGGFQGSLTGRQNVKFVCRVFGAVGIEMKSKVSFVEDFAEIDSYFDRPVKTYSSGMRARVAFGLSLAFDFDYYLIDEILSVGDAQFKKKAVKAFKERMNRSNIILVTHGMTQVRNLCNHVIVLKDGSALSYDDVEEGISVYLES